MRVQEKPYGEKDLLELKDIWDLKRQGDSMESIWVGEAVWAKTFLYFEDERISVCLKHWV